MLFSAITPTPKSRDLATSSTTIETRSESKCKDTPWAVCYLTQTHLDHKISELAFGHLLFAISFLNCIVIAYLSCYK